MSTTETPTEIAAPPAKPAEPSRPRDASDWKGRKTHKDITLPSGTVVDIVLPNIQVLIKSGAIPNTLIDAALKQQNAGKVTREIISETWDFTCWIIPRTVVSPEITEEDVPDLPAEDIELLVGFASRTKDMDAVGHHLAGLETQRSFRDFRGITSLDEVLGNV